MTWQAIHGDCIKVLKTFEPDSFDSIVTDPPYALSFMGKDWDSFGDGKGFQAWCEEWARECLRVLKPGGYLLAFGGTRTYHREACAIEDAGFEIRDSLHWIYGSGFPKSMDVSKAIDKEAGAEREVIGQRDTFTGMDKSTNWACASPRIMDVTAPATDAAKAWEGWGTALKPAHEPIVLARKPLAEKTIAANVLAHGTGAVNIDACRIATDEDRSRPPRTPNKLYGGGKGTNLTASESNPAGRWPPNIILTHSPDCVDDDGYQDCSPDCPVAEMDRQSGTLKSPKTYQYAGKPETERTAYGKGLGYGMHETEYGDTGGASRFFPCFRYQAKAPKSERPQVDGVPAHPTVKPVALMRWLTKLVTPPGGKVLEPFGGTGTTGEAAELEGFDCTLIERESDNIRLIEARMADYPGTIVEAAPDASPARTEPVAEQAPPSAAPISEEPPEPPDADDPPDDPWADDNGPTLEELDAEWAEFMEPTT